MVYAITVDSKDENANISPVFGRCGFFALYDSEGENLSFVENPGTSQQRGAGISAAQTVIDNNVKKVFTGNVGPRAEAALKQGNIGIEVVKKKTVQEIIDSLQK